MPFADGTTMVLGADGFVGRHLVDRWRANGWKVHPVGRAAGDFTDPAVADAALKAAPRAGHILHTITKQRTGAVQYGIQGELLLENSRIHLNVLEAWRHHQPQAKLISLGSSCTYAEAPHPVAESQFGIGTTHPSVRGYAQAKKTLVLGSEAYGSQYGLRWLHCVLATLFGPRAHVEEQRSHFMAAMIDRAVRSKRAGATTFEVWGSLETVRDLLHVADQIDAIIAADAAFENTVVNCTPNAPVTIGTCAESVLRALRWPVPISSPPGSFQGTGYKSIDSSRFLRATGWQPLMTLEQAVADVLRSDYQEVSPMPMMVSRTPLRVSFFGGGTDYPEYFQRARGAVIGMAINQYVYVSMLRLSNILEYRYRVSYSRIETVADAGTILHPVVRHVLTHYRVEPGLDIGIMADLPARSGLGSSSSFTVGLLNLIFAMQGRAATKHDLASGAVFVERELLRENVGVQDQYHAAFGGLNRFDFDRDGTRISPLLMDEACQAALNGSLFLLYTGVTRLASETLEEQIERTRVGSVDRDLSHLLTLTDQAHDVLRCPDPDRMLADFGVMLHEGWETKKRLSSRVSGPAIDALYEAARDAGAVGGKLCGAGSGGFLLMLVPPEKQPGFREALRGRSIIPVGLDTSGSIIMQS